MENKKCLKPPPSPCFVVATSFHNSYLIISPPGEKKPQICESTTRKSTIPKKSQIKNISLGAFFIPKQEKTCRIHNVSMDFVDSNDSDNKGDPIENTNFRSNLPSAHPAASKSDFPGLFHFSFLTNPCKRTKSSSQPPWQWINQDVFSHIALPH